MQLGTCPRCPSWQGASQPGHGVLTAGQKGPSSGRVFSVKGQGQALLGGDTEVIYGLSLLLQGARRASVSLSSRPTRATGLIAGV